MAGVTFVSFVTGTVLYLTGDAHNIIGPAAQRLMPRINALTTIHVTGYILVEDALPVRQKPGTQVERSPYSPPVRHLAEEISSTYFVDNTQEMPKVTLVRIEMHSRDIATFTFESPTRVGIVPGQAAILDFKSFVGALSYQHMAPGDPTSVNDDRIRTWTVSGSSRWAGSSSRSADTTVVPLSLTLTMRHKPGGVVTSALFAIAHQLGELRPELLEDTRPLQLSVPLIGVAGDFTLPTCVDACSSGHGEVSSALPPTHADARKWLWVAGGIGVTPFLAMLAGLKDKKSDGGWCRNAEDIILLLSTREPDVLLPLVIRALECTGDHLEEGHRGRLSIHVFSRTPPSSSPSVTTASRTALAIEVTQHEGRLNKETLRALNIEHVQGRQTYVCGPEDFEQTVLAALKEIGVDSRNVRREGFAY